MIDVDALGRRIAAAAGGTLAAARPVAGGDINEALRLELTDGRALFAKHRRDPPTGSYAAEAAGLAWLAAAGALPVPAIVAVADEFLALEWVESAPRAADFDARLGEGLARLHAAGAPRPGATANGGATFLGPLRLANDVSASALDASSRAAGRDRSAAGPTGPAGRPPAAPADRSAAVPTGPAGRPPAAPADPGLTGQDDWPAFYAHRRLAPLLRLAADTGAVGSGAVRRVSGVIERIADLAGPPEPTARLHGDLWSGNVMAGPDGGPLLVDCAAYGGHREVDLAMLELFGRPGPAFLDAYTTTTPLADGHRDRLALWQLLPLLVHAVLFGGGYGTSVDAAARRYVR